MFDIEMLIQTGGLLLIALIIFAESGMFVGFFLPGDTLLLSAGVFAAQGKLDIYTLIPVIAAAAIAGDNIGYFIGRKYGRRLFSKQDSIVFNPEHIIKAESFFNKYGTKSMLISHFIPVIRTFAPAAAGIAHMDRRRFVIYDAIGIIAWAFGITMAGYLLGTQFPDIDKYIHFAVGFVVVAVVLPALYHFIKAQRAKKRRLAAKSKDKTIL